MDKDLFKYKGMKTIIIILAFLTVIQGVTIILQAKFLAKAVTSLFYFGMDSQVFISITFFLVGFLLRYSIIAVKDKIVYHYADATASAIRKAVLTKLFKLGPRYSKQKGTGDLVTLVMEGTKQLRDYLELFIPKLVSFGLLPLMFAVYIWMLDVRSAIVLIVTMPIAIVFLILLGIVAKAKADRQFASYRVLSNHFVDSLRGLETLKFLGLSKS